MWKKNYPPTLLLVFSTETTLLPNKFTGSGIKQMNKQNRVIRLLVKPIPQHQKYKWMDIFKYNTMQYNTMQYKTMQYNTMQYNTMQYNTMQYNAIQYHTIQWTVIQRTNEV